MNCKSWFRLLALLAALTTMAAAAEEPVWIDVRSLPEYLLDHIDGDLRIAHDEIVEGVRARFPDQETEIHLYCASGGRSELAAAALREAGYRNVSNAGGIDDAREARQRTE